jgi:hypothetical protein
LTGPSLPDGGHHGPRLLEAEVVSVLQCKRSCPHVNTIVITVYVDGRDIEESRIYFVKEAGFDVSKVYPKQLTGPWNVVLTDTHTVYPMSEKANIEQLLITPSGLHHRN